VGGVIVSSLEVMTLPCCKSFLYCPSQMSYLTYHQHALELAIPFRTFYRETVGNVTFPVGKTGSVKLALGSSAVGKPVMMGVLGRRGGLGPAKVDVRSQCMSHTQFVQRRLA
jgi:hypothetical protein